MAKRGQARKGAAGIGERSPELAALHEASAGLTYPSESDEPFEAFAWPAAQDPANDTAIAMVTARSPKGCPVVEQSVDEFFSQLDATPDAERFRHLREVLIEQLSDVKVLRAGEIRVAVYLLGKAKSGVWAGLRTLSIET